MAICIVGKQDEGNTFINRLTEPALEPRLEFSCSGFGDVDRVERFVTSDIIYTTYYATILYFTVLYVL